MLFFKYMQTTIRSPLNQSDFNKLREELPVKSLVGWKLVLIFSGLSWKDDNDFLSVDAKAPSPAPDTMFQKAFT